jgi:hypothetical protein
MESKLRNLDRDISRLPGSRSAGTDSLRSDYTELRLRLSELSSSSDEEWATMRNDLELRYRDVRRDVDATASRVAGAASAGTAAASAAPTDTTSSTGTAKTK